MAILSLFLSMRLVAYLLFYIKEFFVYTCRTKPYEPKIYPGERVQVDVKVVPRCCLADLLYYYITPYSPTARAV